MEESEEQAYWLQLLSDLGSQQALPPADVHTDENTNESLQSYMYLDHEENSHSDLPTQAFSLHHVDSSRDLASEAVAMNNDINNIPSSPIYGPILDFKSTNQYQISPSGEDEVSMALQRIGRLKKYSAPKTSKVWEDEYPVVLEIVKQDFIFTNTYTDITESTPESNSSSELNGEEDEEREEDEDALPDYSERQAATSNTDFVPARKNIRRTVSAQTRIVQSVSNATSEGLQRTLVIAGGVGSAMANTMTIVAQKVFEQLLEHLSQNFVVSSVVGCVHESANFISDRSKTLAALYLHQITFDDPEQMRLEKIKHASSWEHVLLRYSMATLSWKQRQLLKETRDIDDFNKGESMKAATLSTSDKGHADSFEQKNLQIIDQAKSNLHAMLAMEAESSEDDDVQYILARYFTAPGFCEAKNCCICAKTFGLALFRHHCRNCGGSVCEDHSKSRRPIFRYGMIQPVRVCDKCAFIADEVHRMDELMWKDGRVRAYLEGSLIHYHQQQLDRGIDKAIRYIYFLIIHELIVVY